jgi:hypothetical protein
MDKEQIYKKLKLKLNYSLSYGLGIGKYQVIKDF